MVKERRNRFTFVLLLTVLCFTSLLPAATEGAEKDKKRTVDTAKKKLKKIPLRITSMPDPKTCRSTQCL